MAEPYYQDDMVTLYHGDCREILPSLTADVVLTDLPYAIGMDYGDTYTDDAASLDALVVDTLPSMQKCAPVVALTSGIGNWWRYPPPTWVLCWYQLDACSSTGKWGFNQWQPVLVYGTDPYLRRGLGRRPDVVVTTAAKTGADKRLGHPCPKPAEVWKKILLRVSPSESDVIVDPLMGSGTSVVAAKYTGRRAVGIDINERYCEIAARRLAQDVLPFAPSEVG